MITLLEKCMKIAEEAHKGQIRKYGNDKGKPYIIHPRRVASVFDHLEQQCVAYLHDTLEDTSITRKHLEDAEIPHNIIAAVETISRIRGESYLEFILRVSKNPLGKTVKIEDIRDNMMSLEEGSLKDKYRLALYILEWIS